MQTKEQDKEWLDKALSDLNFEHAYKTKTIKEQYKLIKRLIKSGMTQAQIAKHLKVQPSEITKLKQGVRIATKPQMTKLRYLSKKGD